VVSTPRCRFAPSPTGYLHVGSAQSALFNWLFARGSGGEFLLRIEDTDAERNRPELTDNILDMLRWLGLEWDGEPVHQSDRSEQYTAAAQQLFASGHAYYCDCTPGQVQARHTARGGKPGYDGFCRDRGLGPGPGRALRFRTPDDGETAWDDVIRGKVSFDNDNLEDFVLLRSVGTPTFLLANATDDAAMGITHVIRGEDHVNGTPKYLLVRSALGLGEPPTFAHLPLLVNEQRKKLSKRRDDVSVADYKARGYLPEAMRNYLALLGWGPSDGVEIRPIEEIIELFRLEDVNPSPAFFDRRKLDHINAEYIRALPVEEFLVRADEFVTHGPDARAALAALAPQVQERIRTLDEAEDFVDFLWLREPEIDPAAWEKVMVKNPRAATALDAAIMFFASIPFEPEPLRSALEDIAVRAGFVNAEGQPQLAKAQAPVRVAVTGRTVGPPLFESLAYLGRDATLARLRAARAALG
jgi:glutamyl-tRNA synthetase